MGRGFHNSHAAVCEKERVAHMSDKLMKATMGKYLKRNRRRSAWSKAEIHPAVTHGTTMAKWVTVR